MSGSTTERPNFLLITLDSLRYDALGCNGNPIVQTPNIDRLSDEGVCLEHHFSQSPVCSPSRATLATGRYPHAHGTKYVWYDLDPQETTLQAVLGEAGYETLFVGKTHFEPLTESHGFDKKFMVEGKLYNGDDEYRRHLDQLGKRARYKRHAANWNNDENFGAYPSPFSDEDYIDTFIGRNAAALLREVRPPFFAWVSFVNPHMPIDPPKPFDSMYDPGSIPLPEDFCFRQDSRLPEHRIASASKSFHRLDTAKFQKFAAYYYATVSLVDREVGRALEALAEKGVLDDTVVIFTSDHGDLMGHRGMVWKGGQMLYDHIVHVPMIVRYPNDLPSGKVISDLTQHTDIMPTVLDYAGLPVPPGVQGLSMRPVMRQDISLWRDAVFSESMHVKMVRDFHWKLIFYGGKPYGELYHLSVDPLELRNLYDEPGYERMRASMVEKLADVLIRTEDPLPLPSVRPGYGEAAGFRSEQELGASSFRLSDHSSS